MKKIDMQVVQSRVESCLEQIEKILGPNFTLALIAKANPECGDADIILTMLKREQILHVVDRHMPGKDSSVVTCVYCGHAYPDGTPTHKAEVLTEHIKVCEKHPMREAEKRIERLRKAVVDFVGAECKEELEAMEVAIRLSPAPDADKATAINAIHALLAEVSRG